MDHDTYMKLALTLAEAARGQTSPNPLVGCVLVRDGEIVGMGAHLRAGEAHAEVQALRMAGERARGATAYVTLEPCSHHGRTPPCANALIASGVASVVIASSDPNPLVAGRGVARLREAGISVTCGVCEEEAKRLNEVFFTYITKKRPFVTSKTAMTLDGKVATQTGSSRWITGEAARLDVHRMRHEHDAILVGVGTVIADDPQLTTRLPEEKGRNPVRIVLDTALRTPETARMLTDGEAPVWVFTTDRADQAKRTVLESMGVRVFSTGMTQRVHIETMLGILGEEGITSLLVEGGSEVNASFLAAGAVDKLVTYVAPKLVAGHLAPTPFGGIGVEQMADAIDLADLKVETVGVDLKISGYPVWKERPCLQD